ncbi:cytochrome c oxidase, subunit VIa [Halteromyces radiatus]|uniref:cytochrome c oxidase, subunit VIa n=1 Tax=Halteromyces radiatus TaxID=101107 RepID=UPI00221F65C1|nr:cytochrome c oxidase, subunit VIa [Halteromyces radiatus]KAI8099841.1 cytochrome c oxidase, subunit VIa [Halteromyces radiatus]
MNRALQPLRMNTKRTGVRYQSQLLEQWKAEKAHAAEAADTWKKITLYVAIPALLASGINAYNLYSHHVQHQKEHPHKFVKYEYINFRVRPFFWGNNSLLFNPKVNLDANEE